MPKNGRAARQFWAQLVLTSLSMIGGVLLLLLGPDELTRSIGCGLLGVSSTAGVGVLRGKNLAVLLVPLLVLGAGCGTPWYVTTGKSLQGASDAAKASWNMARPMLGARCMAIVEECGKPPVDRVCQKKTECQDARDKIGAVFAGIHMIAAGGLLIVETGRWLSDFDRKEPIGKALQYAIEAWQTVEEARKLIAAFRKAY